MPPDYIVNNWTYELLALMVGKLVERKERSKIEVPDEKVSDKLLFSKASNLIKVEDHGDKRG